MQGPSQPKRQRRCDIPVFIFQQHCLFCGLECNIVKDKKHPHRWRKASLCRTADRGSGKETFKDAVMDICAQRGDNWANQVLVRVQGAVSDLHAADARYHHDCMARFMSKKAVEQAARESPKEAENRDEAFEIPGTHGRP